MTDNKKEIPGLSPASIKMDLLRFKDDILKDIRTVQSSLDDKYLQVDEFIKGRIENFELKINSFSQKIAELSNLIITDTTIREKVESFDQFKEEIRDTIFKRRAKFSELEKKVYDDSDRINKILTDSVIYPSLIGKNSKFKNFHEFMDYVVEEITQLEIFKEKSGLDLTPYKRKIDLTVDALKLQMNNLISKDLLDNAISKTEENIKSILRIYDDRLQDTRVENSHYSFGLEKKAKEISKQMENLQKAFKKLEKKQNDDILNEYNNELNNINSRLDKMYEIIKELLEYHPASKKIFFPEFERKTSKVYSGVKQYIKGNINANELTSMKKFTYEKSKSKVFDKSYPSPTTSPFPSEDIIKNKNYDFQHKISNPTFINNNSPFFLNNQINNNTNNTRIDKRKMFLSQKSMNVSHLRDSLTRKLIELDNSKKEKNDKIIKKNTFVRRKTYNYGKINTFEMTKMNNDGKKESKNDNSFNKENEDDFSDSFIKDENISNNKDKIIIDNTQNAIKKCGTTIRKGNRNQNQFVIKEEDEYILSDCSYKNAELSSTRRNHKNPSVKNNSEEEKENENQDNINNTNKDNNNNNNDKNNNKDSKNDKDNNNNTNYNSNNANDSNNNTNDNNNNINDNNINKDNNNNNNDNNNNNNDNNNNKDDKNRNDNKEDIPTNNDKFIHNIVNEPVNDESIVNNDSKSKSVFNNNDENLSILIKSDNSDIKRLQILKEKLNTDNESNNNKIKLLSIKKKTSHTETNKNKLLIIDDNNYNKILAKKIEQNESNEKKDILKKLEDNNNQRSNHLQPVVFELKENKSHKCISNNASMPKTARAQNPNVIYFQKNGIQKSQNVPNYNSLDTNVVRSGNPLNYSYKPNYNNNIIAIHKTNKTYSNFPKINQDLSEQRQKHNNFIDSKDINLISQTLSAAKIQNPSNNTKVAAYVQKPKKILLTSPDNIPLNGYIWKKAKNFVKNNSSGIQKEKADSNSKKLKNIFNNGYY